MELRQDPAAGQTLQDAKGKSRTPNAATRNAKRSAMLFQLISAARERGLRAVAARTLTNNLPANLFLSKAGFELTGIDTGGRRRWP